MSKFEVLCVTVGQTDFSKIEEMNIHSDVVYANQCDRTNYEEICFDGKHKARMISTETRGVGINRNTALMYANADYCLFADDDVVYEDGLEEMIVSEFESHPEADVFIFNFTTKNENRKQKIYNKTRKCTFFEKMPWGGFRIAVRLSSVKKKNIWFTTLFGGGCIFPSGEDSLWLKNAKKAGLVFYVSDKIIGKVSFDESTWFTGYNEKYFFAKGAYYQAASPKTSALWKMYFSFRTKKLSDMKLLPKIKWMNIGSKCYKKLMSYEEYCKSEEYKVKL